MFTHQIPKAAKMNCNVETSERSSLRQVAGEMNAQNVANVIWATARLASESLVAALPALAG